MVEKKWHEGFEDKNSGLKRLLSELNLRKEELSQSLKGGKNKLETKSRYEVIADLEKQKRNLIRERESFPDEIREKELEIKQLKRRLEDEEEELKNFKDSVKERKETIKELIKGVDQSLERFSKLQKSK